MRVLSFDVGGNFGTRNRVYAEYGLVLWASRKLGRPVKFTATRSECFLSDYQGRDLVAKFALALDAKGRFLALRATNISNAGARCVSLSPLSKGSGLITGNYVIPVASLRAVSVFTNTIPTQAYRSSGRPEVTFAIERLIDIAAAKLGIDRISLRRRNLVRPESMPYRNAVGMTYDSGRYEDNMDLAMRIADWAGFTARRREARKRGRLLGLGLANYVESSIGAPKEQARITIKPEGRVDVIIGTQPAGQGHETSFAQVVAGPAARAARKHQHHHRRHRRGARRRRLAFRPLDAPCRHRVLDRRHHVSSPTASASPRSSSAPRPTASTSTTAALPRAKPTAASISSNWPRR